MPARRALGVATALTTAALTLHVADELHSPFERLQQKFSELEGETDEGLNVTQFMVALAPDFLSSEAQEQFSKRKPDSFSAVLRDAGDLSGNKRVHFAEFAFFTSLLSVPMRDMGICFRLFDEDGSGTLEHDEFLKVVSVVTRGRFNLTKLELPTLFGRRKQVSMKEFLAWTEKIKMEVARLEFDLLDDDGDGKISAIQFGRSLTGYSSAGSLDRARAELQDSDYKLTFADFWAYQRSLEDLTRVDDAMVLFIAGQSDGVSRAQFKRAVSAVSNVEMPDSVVETLFLVFDEGDGKLCRSKFRREMDSRLRRGQSSSEEGVSGVTTCFRNCWNSTFVTREPAKMKN